MRTLNFWHLLSLFLLGFPSVSLAAVLAIDYGSDWIKASLMKPGVPFDVLLNKDSKRKIQSSVGWKRDDRLFGGDAFNMASRFPSDSFSSLKILQAAPYDSEIVSYYTSVSTAQVVESVRHTAALKQSDGTEWSVEELIAMQLAYVKSLAESVAGEKVYDVILTVPAYYSQFERDAVADAIEIAGLRTLALINDGSAVAVNYAMTRTFPTPEYHIIYDAGASSIRATLVSFSTDSKTSSTQITVHGVGYDRGVGGTELDKRVREILVDQFVAKHGKDIRKDKRGMAKLWKEAGRVKSILSANTEATSHVESLAFDIDFRSKVTRAQFETACEDLKSRYVQPIIDAMANGKISSDKLVSVILTGGSTRTPMIQAAVKALVGDDKIALNVNADEAAVLGAALYGAGLSRQFKTKDIRLTDILAHDVQASYLAAPAAEGSKTRTITTLIFPAGSKVNSKKTLTFKRKEDFSIHFDYKNPVAPGFPTQLLEVEFFGVAEALGNLTERGATNNVVKATVQLSESGFISVTEAVATGDIKDESLTGKLKGLFGGGSTESLDEETASAGSETPIESDTSSSSSSSSSSASSSSETSPAPSKSAEAKISLKELGTITLNFTSHLPTITPMTVEEKKKARSRLRALDLEEAAKVRKEEARNNLESYLYRLRDLLDDENKDTPFKKCSRPSERQALADTLEETFFWLHDQGDDADTSVLLDKRIALETLERPIQHRYQEIEAFPQALNNSQMWNWSTRLFLTEARQNLTREMEADLPSKWTKEELDGLEKTLKEHETWLNIWVEKQKSVKSYEDPVIETTEMKARAKVLETHLQKLAKRRVPKPRKTSTTSSPSSTSASSTITSETAVPTDRSKEQEEVEQQIPVDGSEQVPLQQQTSHPEDIRDEL
ncbi:Hsp70 protein-domain-containing protein [Lentinula detonsa]|uniref:Hsp70 protein-domain-containing protein n=1 Tax=Lentinula detonsa TaxID=2804962 RepID=A0A9W8NY21_9AGAR|nr:Hsp70 protein-domain-containing protein [Lentinula detonsa]KAJ3800143.1 Hsp70 protein-domain-containing protein [Lentinula aff. detonsa]